MVIVKNLVYGCFENGGHVKVPNSNSKKTASYTDIDIGKFGLVNFIPYKNKSNFKKTRFTNF